MVRDGVLDASTVVTHRFPLERASEAYELVASYKDGVIKAVVEGAT